MKKQFEMSALQFKRNDELGVIEASFLYWACDSGISVSFTKYYSFNDVFVLSGIGNVYWNDSFEISNKILMSLLKNKPAIIEQIESKYQDVKNEISGSLNE